jgi:ribosome-associated protein
MQLDAYLENNEIIRSDRVKEETHHSIVYSPDASCKKTALPICLEDVLASLSSMKSENQVTLPLHGKSSIVDYMVIVSGTSDRHVKSIADKLVYDLKNLGCGYFCPELGQDNAWVLLDLGVIIVHIFKQETRDLYALEKMWSVNSDRSLMSEAVQHR